MKVQTVFIALTMTVGLLAVTQVQAANIERGKELVQENCMTCHDSIMGGNGNEIYTRPNRRIHSLSELRQQVKRCKNSLKEPWPDDQIDDVVSYLNQTFYKFGK
jgi:mono/diheme cytochrome c family protein